MTGSNRVALEVIRKAAMKATFLTAQEEGFASPEWHEVSLHVDTQVHCHLTCFFSAVALETGLNASFSLVLPVYCKLLCHGRARARVSGLEGGGKGSSSRTERWGKGGTLISCEERKKRETSAHSLTSYLHIHSCLSLYLVCLRGPLLVSDRSRRSGFGGRFACRLVLFFLFTGSASGLPVSLISV